MRRRSGRHQAAILLLLALVACSAKKPVVPPEQLWSEANRAFGDEAYELAVDRYKAGMGNYITVLIAQTGVLTQARLDTDLRIRAYQLDANLATALGGGYAPPAEPAPNSIH